MKKMASKEYIIIDPTGQYVEQYLMGEDGTYMKAQIFGPKEVLRLVSLEGIEISLWDVFEVAGPEEQE